MWLEEFAKINDNGTHTCTEIIHQPELWRKIWKDIYENRNEIKEFVTKNIKQSDNLILTGAGTSSYIGIAVQRSFRNKFKMVAEPISSTHIVSHPQNFLLSDQSLFLVSFARSGNSPESFAVIDLANQFSKGCTHLIITCNADGKLAKDYNNENSYVYILPPESNDRSLAMTSSFTGMMLAAVLISRIDEIAELETEIEKLCEYGEYCLKQSAKLNTIAKLPFKRVIFLGSGSLYGVAKEAQLKMQELSDGLVIGKHDSFLGLRHGPKAVIDPETLVVYHLNNNCFAKKYELDLIRTMKENSKPLGVLAIGESVDDQQYLDWVIDLNPNDKTPLDEDLLSVASILPSQLLSMFKSVQLGLKPDNPSRNGAISRVVKGVNIYQTQIL